ncbi:retron St85 family effector protein [Shewanella waksmanii]|uniref:retron St85 family effector protein n=1 Tax=Shewanella waksmanii TaxID=213783 RepID=UPI0037368CD6
MWYKHPRYLNAKKRFIKESNASTLGNLSSHLPKIIFICGGDEKKCHNREKIESYLDRYHSKLLHFRAEYAWAEMSSVVSKSNTNALDLEKWLAGFSDAVVILVESFGTVAELGAFSISDPLRKKLLPILDKKFQNDDSFINTGPIRWVDNDSVYKPSVYTDFSTILTCMPEVVSRLEAKTVYKSRDLEDRFGNLEFSRKELMFFILYIVTALGPISAKEICDISHSIIDYGKGAKHKNEISFILSLCIALRLVEFTVIDETKLFTCVDYVKLYRHESTKRALRLSQHLRARCLSDLLLIPEFNETLRKVDKNVA